MSICLSAPDATSLPSLPQEQAAKTNMASVVRNQVFSICTVEEGVANTRFFPHEAGKALHLLYRSIERRWRIPNKSPFDRPLTLDLIVWKLYYITEKPFTSK